MQVVNAFCGLFCCGHCHKAIATGSRTPSICHNLSPHHLTGKQRNVSDMKPPNIHHSKLLSSDPPQVLAPSWNEDPWGNPVTRCLKRGRWLGRIMLLSWRYYSPRATSISGYSFREPGWQHGEERKVKWRQSSGSIPLILSQTCKEVTLNTQSWLWAISRLKTYLQMAIDIRTNL